MRPAAATTDLFRHQAALYAAHRPTYPPELFDAVLAFAGLPQRDVALDVATGTGQVAAELAGRFTLVLACDSTQQQLDHAEHRPNLRYFLAPAERLEGVESGSVDLVTAAQSLHWFDVPAFYREARRVLRPHGALAIWGYGMPLFSSPSGRPPHPAAAVADVRRLLLRLDLATLGDYWHPRRWLVDNCYRGMEPGPAEFGAVRRRDDLLMCTDMSLDALVGYLSTWSSYTSYRRQHPEAPDPLAAFREQALQALGLIEEQGASPEPVLRVEWPVFLILAKDPLPLPA